MSLFSEYFELLTFPHLYGEYVVRFSSEFGIVTTGWILIPSLAISLRKNSIHQSINHQVRYKKYIPEYMRAPGGRCSMIQYLHTGTVHGNTFHKV